MSSPKIFFLTNDDLPYSLVAECYVFTNFFSPFFMNFLCFSVLTGALDQSKRKYQTKLARVEGRHHAQQPDNTRVEGRHHAQQPDNRGIEGRHKAEKTDNARVEGRHHAQQPDNARVEGRLMTHQPNKPDTVSSTSLGSSTKSIKS